MKANRISKCTFALILSILFALFFVAGCSHDTTTPQTLEQQKADVSGPGQIPPDVLAKARSMYSPNSSYQQQVQQAVNSPGKSNKPAGAPTTTAPPQAQPPASH